MKDGASERFTRDFAIKFINTNYTDLQKRWKIFNKFPLVAIKF
jgi:hypothetical protein